MARKRGEPVHGWVALDKPYGMTSTQAVGKIRWLFNAGKAGHGGTLDPLATGLLPIALGEATKTVPFAMEGRKVYRFTASWGEERSTDDLEGEVTARSDNRPTQQEIEALLQRFTGDILQAPPAFSAIKVAGERAYDLARAGDVPDLAPRPVRIESLRVIEAMEDAHLSPSPQGGGAGRPRVQRVDSTTFEVTCGKGTYVRSLARDMGRALGCLGHVSMLRRVAVGPFTEAHMISLEKLEELRHKAAAPDPVTPEPGALPWALLPIETVLDGIPALAVDGSQAQRLRQGREVLLRGASAPIACDAVLVQFGGTPVGLCTIAQGLLKPKRLFNL